MPYKKTFWQHLPPSHRSVYRAWLTDSGSLTQRLQSRCKEFRVALLTQQFARPCQDEAALVNLAPRTMGLVREVILYCDHRPVVFAHTVLDPTHLRGVWRSLTYLGNRPLGAALFSNPRIKRRPLQLKKLNRRHRLYRQVASILKLSPPYLWARRSLFYLAQQPALVTEVFLPAILELEK